MKHHKRLVSALLGSALMVIPASAAGTTLTVDPLQSSVAVGGTTEVELTVSGLGNRSAPSLSAFDLEFLFDSSVLSIAKTVFGTSSAPFNQLDLSGAGPITAVAQPTPGDLHLQEISQDSAALLDSQQLGSFAIAEITLRGTSTGVAALSLSVNALGDSQGNPLAVSSLIGANLTVGPSSAVPEPNTLSSLGFGLLVLLYWRATILSRNSSTDS